MSPLTTHVLDTATGLPAADLSLKLDRLDGSEWTPVAHGRTNHDGRVANLLAPGDLHVGIWRLRFDTGAWYATRGQTGFYPWVDVVFEVTETTRHHHVPLLLSPYGYSTYRGS
jgi:5-hydroxyisourate hydrolase